MITLATLKDATAQQVFDQVANHLLTQLKVSVNSDDSLCQYHSDDGTKCAAGCLIADNEYSLCMEGIGNWTNIVEQGFASSHHENLIFELQEVHDSAMGIPMSAELLKEFWTRGLKGVADRFNLEFKQS